MKRLLIVAALFACISCGRDGDNGINGINGANGANGTSAVVNSSIINKFEAVGTGLHGVNELDFSAVTLGAQTVDTKCNGSYGNNGNVSGVAQGKYVLYGSSDFGFLQFGHLAYIGATPSAVQSACSAMSKERYSYQIRGTVLTLCMINYPFCADYNVVQ